ncbi:hypothetical protein K438DRAFT_1876073, partial [Mycena galopus ATCC 62051]
LANFFLLTIRSGCSCACAFGRTNKRHGETHEALHGFCFCLLESNSQNLRRHALTVDRRSRRRASKFAEGQ